MAIEAMRIKFPAWGVWVNNQSTRPEQTLAGYADVIKPLALVDVRAAIDRMAAVVEPPPFRQLVAGIRFEAEQIRAQRQQPTDDDIRDKRREFHAQRAAHRETAAAPGTSWRAMLQLIDVKNDAAREYPDNDAARAQYISDESGEVWRQYDAAKSAALSENIDDLG